MAPESNPSDDEPESDQSDNDASELSLAELSEAYASVLKQKEGQSDADSDGEEDELQESDVEDEENDDKSESSTAVRKPKKQITIQQMDAADNAACSISPRSIVESLLFVGTPSGEKLSLKKIAAVMRDVSPKEVKKTIGELNQSYEDDGAAFRIVEADGHVKMQLCSDLVEVQNFFFGRNKAAKLSQGAIDVLAVVAYNQPVTRARIDKIRTRPSGSVLGQLVRRNLVVAVDGEKKEKLYRTSDRFLELFGLGTLEDLPQTSVVSDLEELTDY